MVAAGCAWGVYSLAGKGAPNVLEANARSFIWALPAVMFLNVIASSGARASGRGLLLAVIAGGITSGLGYAIWYRALRGLTATTAAVLQLSVPVIAAGGAVALLDETLSPRLIGGGGSGHRRREPGAVAAGAGGARPGAGRSARRDRHLRLARYPALSASDPLPPSAVRERGPRTPQSQGLPSP